MPVNMLFVELTCLLPLLIVNCNCTYASPRPVNLQRDDSNPANINYIPNVGKRKVCSFTGPTWEEKIFLINFVICN